MSDTANNQAPKIGDYVQWEPKGILQFREPKRIRAFSDDGQFAFVDGGITGLPIGELTLQPTADVNAGQKNRICESLYFLFQKARFRRQ